MEETGILQKIELPQSDLSQLWQRIVLPKALKETLIGQVAVEFSMRGKFPKAAIPLHGIILLIGPPGTGKTTICRGLASVAAEFLSTTMTLIEIEPHSLTGSQLGKSQREVRELFQKKLPEYTAQGPIIVLLDEVETLAIDRTRLSLDANPVDVHRATDAILASLDWIAEQYPQILFLATSNFEGAIDPAFLSRADIIVRVEKPTRDACEAILKDTLSTLVSEYENIRSLLHAPEWNSLVDEAVGLDDRQLRKAVVVACAFEKEVAVNPNGLRMDLLLRALKQMKYGAVKIGTEGEILQ